MTLKSRKVAGMQPSGDGLAKALGAVNTAEDGHAGPLPGALAGAAGVVMLGIGAAGDTGWLAITGGIVAGVGVLAAFVMNHIMVEYEFYRRLEELEKK